MKEKSKDFYQIFVDLSEKYSEPFRLSGYCHKELTLIIKTGVLKIEEASDKEEMFLKAKQKLYLFIEEMKKNASGKELTQKDFERAKEKFCPTWPCE